MISYEEMMSGISNAPFDYGLCGKCGGVGFVLLGCCSGYECGCKGKAVDVERCDCGIREPTDAQILRWAYQPPEVD